MSTSVLAPLSGTVVAIEDVPDPVFAGKFVGPGLALEPERAPGDRVTATAPVSGTLAKVHPHAFVIADDAGRAILVHLGLDTVGLAGDGFEVHASEGSAVSVGDPIVTWSPGDIEARGLNPIVPVVALEATETDLELTAVGTRLKAGAPLLTWR